MTTIFLSTDEMAQVLSKYARTLATEASTHANVAWQINAGNGPIELSGVKIELYTPTTPTEEQADANVP